MKQTSPRLKSPSISRSIALGFGALFALAVAMCVLLLSIVYEVSGQIDQMRHDEGSIEAGRALGAEVRDYFLELALVKLNEQPPGEEYNSAKQRVSSRISEAALRVPEHARQRLNGLSLIIDNAHSTTGAKTPRPSSLTRFEHSLRTASSEADIVAKRLNANMIHTHIAATESTTQGLVGGVAFLGLIAIASFGFWRQLQLLVFRPLVQLNDATIRIGAGDYSTPVGQLSRGELRALALALDQMCEEIRIRERKIATNERLAAIGQLATGMAHELNNPIGVIRGYISAMDLSDDPTQLAQELNVIDEEASYCQAIIQDLLIYARLDQIYPRRTEIDELLHSVADRMSATALGSTCSISVHAQPLSIQVDPVKIRQVVQNLISNAIAAAPKGSSVAVRGLVKNSVYRIEVSDLGPGIPTQLQARVFEPFFTTRESGTGLGLAVAEGIATAHGGSIGIQSNPDQKGCCVYVDLPLHTEKEGR